MMRIWVGPLPWFISLSAETVEVNQSLNWTFPFTQSLAASAQRHEAHRQEPRVQLSPAVARNWSLNEHWWVASVWFNFALINHYVHVKARNGKRGGKCWRRRFTSRFSTTLCTCSTNRAPCCLKNWTRKLAPLSTSFLTSLSARWTWFAVRLHLNSYVF